MEKKKVLLIYGAYGKNYEFLSSSLLEYSQWINYDVTVVVMVTEPIVVPFFHNIKVEFRKFDASEAQWFLWKYQEVVREFWSPEYELLVFLEDDIRITEDNLNYYVEHSDRLRGTKFLVGFIAYEVWNGIPYLIGMTEKSWDTGRMFEHDGIRYWTCPASNRMIPQVHQCSFLIDRERLQTLFDNDQFYIKPEHYFWGTHWHPQCRRYMDPTASATNWMWKLYFSKAWPVDDMKRILLHHVDHAYWNIRGLSVESWMNYILQKHSMVEGVKIPHSSEVSLYERVRGGEALRKFRGEFF